MSNFDKKRNVIITRSKASGDEILRDYPERLDWMVVTPAHDGDELRGYVVDKAYIDPDLDFTDSRVVKTLQALAACRLAGRESRTTVRIYESDLKRIQAMSAVSTENTSGRGFETRWHTEQAISDLLDRDEAARKIDRDLGKASS